VTKKSTMIVYIENQNRMRNKNYDEINSKK